MNTTSTDFITAVRAVRAVSGSLSIIGASLIIGTFITFKSTRTAPRFMLVNLAVADLIIGISFFPDISEDTLCTIQAGLRVFGLNSAIFWITAIPLYMFVAFVLLKPYNKKVATLIFVFCWAAPFIITLWLALCHHLGRNFDITRSCFITTLNSTIKDPDGDGDDDDDTNCEKMVLSWSHHYPLIMGYLVWNSMSFVILPLLYIAIRCRIWRLKVQLANTGGVTRHNETDQKLVLLPLIYIVLRIGSCVRMILFTSVCNFDFTLAAKIIQLILVFLEPLQGFVNGMLFVVFTRSIRREVASSLCRRKLQILTSIDPESTTHLNSDQPFVVSAGH